MLITGFQNFFTNWIFSPFLCSRILSEAFFCHWFQFENPSFCFYFSSKFATWAALKLAQVKRWNRFIFKASTWPLPPPSQFESAAAAVGPRRGAAARGGRGWCWGWRGRGRAARGRGRGARRGPARGSPALQPGAAALRYRWDRTACQICLWLKYSFIPWKYFSIKFKIFLLINEFRMSHT